VTRWRAHVLGRRRSHRSLMSERRLVLRLGGPGTARGALRGCAESPGSSAHQLRPVCTVRFFFQAEDGIRDATVTGVQTCALPIFIFAKIRPRTTAARVATDADSDDAPSAFSWLNALLLVLLVGSGVAAWRSLRAPVRAMKVPPAEARAPLASLPPTAELPPPTMAALVAPPG